MTPASGATPLVALDAVAVDTETTGLDAQVARIIEIGAVTISRGRTDNRRSLATLVDPGMAIPPASTAIHGIDDAMVRGAPTLRNAWSEVERFASGRVLIGHSIGFDLAVLEREAARAGIAWVRPRSLCVRLLSAIANPRLPDNSLETVASWLGIALADRHRALGDATAAADVFVGLIPRLQECGIRTLAEAERACLGLTEQMEAHHRAGWAEPAAPSAPSPDDALGIVDPYAYRHRVGEVMSSPPIVVRAATDVRAVIDLMVARRISCAFVSEAGEGGEALDAYGIVTERDMMRCIAVEGGAVLQRPVGAFASGPLASVRAEAYVYRAIGRMDRLGIRHLAVRDGGGNLVGVVSSRDLLRLRASAVLSLGDRIEAAATATDLAAAWSTLPMVAAALIAEEIDARKIASIVSDELRAATRRAARIAEDEMLAEGLGAPPCPYAIMVLGSGGRGESLLAADQDNAIVFASGEPGGQEDSWFAALGEKMAAHLDTAGIPFCKGGVMAKNPAWRGSSALWKERVAAWVGRSRPEDLLDVDIFFDQSAVHGDAALARELFEHSYRLGAGNPVFAKLLGEQAATGGSPFTLLGGLRTSEGRIDLKIHGLFPLVAFARAAAIRHGVRQRSTRKRLEGLMALDIGGDADFANLVAAHGVIMKAMLGQQSRDLLAGIPVSNRVEVSALSRQDLTALKAALRSLEVLPDLLRDVMFR